MPNTAEDIATRIDPQDTAQDTSADQKVLEPVTDDKKVDDAGKQGDDTGDKSKAYVPLNVMHKMRDEFQAKVSGLEEKLGKYATLDERLNQFTSEREKEQKAKAEAEAPKFDDQPSEYLRREQEQLGKRHEELAEGQKKISEQLTQQQQVQSILQRIGGNETAFLKTNTDYYEALGFIREKERERMAMFGYGPEEIEQALAMGEIQTAAALMERGKSPAEYIYTLAKSFGYTNKQAEAEGQLDQVEKNLKASKTLGSGGQSASDIVNAPKEEFDAIMSSLFKR